VLLRACWDYHLYPGAFTGWLERLSRDHITVWNPPQVVSWNMNKCYLLDLQKRGFEVVPTVWLPKGSKANLSEVIEERGWQSAVVKPAISASAYQTWRTDMWRSRQFQKSFEECLSRQDMLVQPYCDEVERQGEWSLIFLGGEFSHAVRKRPQPGDFRVQTEYGGSAEVADPPPGSVQIGQRLLASFERPLLYARVDGFDCMGRFVLMELELIEPFLFLSLAPRAALRMAEAIDKLLTA